MVAWQYDKINVSEIARNSDEIDRLCAAGERGWELVAVMPHGVAYLKRQLGADAPAPVSGQRSAPSRKKSE